MNARRHCPPPPTHPFPTRAIRSVRLSSYAARTSLVAPFGWPRRSQATGLRRLYHLSETPADAMIDVTLVVLLSVRRELRSEYAELSFDIFCVLPHSVPVKIARWLTPGSETAGQLYSKRLSISYHPTPGKWQAATNTTPLLRGMQAAAFTCADLTRRSGVKCEWYLQAAVQIALISFRAWSQPRPTQLGWTEPSWVELSRVGHCAHGLRL